MKVYIPNNSQQGIGGGWTFLNNFSKAFNQKYVAKALPPDTTDKVRQDEIVGRWEDCDVVLITGATMTSRDEIKAAKGDGKKIVFRVDNIPKDSRNRGTAFSRMVDFAKMADFIVFQSEWARDYAGWWFAQNGVDITDGVKSKVVYNGVDSNIFKRDESVERVKDRYLYVQYNRDENKRFPEAAYLFHQIYRDNPNAELWLVGQFSPEVVGYGFDFFAGEDISYLGVIKSREQLAGIYNACDKLIFPAFADASPNTVMEARACGCEVVGTNPIGGTKELLPIINRSIYDMANDYRKIFYNLYEERN